MRPAFRILRAVAALGGAALLVVPVFTAPATAEDETVAVGETENRFTPATVRIRPGDTVTWQYAGGSGHTVTSTTRNWDKDDAVGPPAVLNFTTTYMFEDAGTYRYVCETHESVGMRGTVIVEGPRPSRSPTRTPTRSPSPTRTRTPAPPSPSPSETPSASASATPSATPTPSAGTATPPAPSGSALPPSPTTPAPLPSIAPSTPGSTFLGSGGLTPHPATGRARGLPVMLALLLIGGVGSAELRALLASAPRS